MSTKTSWYTVQPKDQSTIGWDVLTPTNSTDVLDKPPANMNEMQAKNIDEVLYKRIAYVSGGKDRNGRYILTIPNIREPYPYPEVDIGLTLRYLVNMPSEVAKSRGFAILLDARYTSWSAVKPIIRKLQFFIPDEIEYIYVVRPEDFWQKQKAILSFKKYRDMLGYDTILISTEKLNKYVDKSQLTRQLGGWLQYNHNQWIRSRIEYERQLVNGSNNINNNNSNGRPMKRSDETDTTTEPDSEYMSDSGHVSAGSPTTSNSTSSRSSKYSRRNRQRHRRSADRRSAYENNRGIGLFESNQVTSPPRARSTSPLAHIKSNEALLNGSEMRLPNNSAPRSARENSSSDLCASPTERSIHSLPTSRSRSAYMPAPLRQRHRSHDNILSSNSDVRSHRSSQNMANNEPNTYRPMDQRSVNSSSNQSAMQSVRSVNSPNSYQITNRTTFQDNGLHQQERSQSVKMRRNNNRNRNSKDVRRRTLMSIPTKEDVGLIFPRSRSGVARSSSCGNIPAEKEILSPEKIEKGLRTVYDWIVGIGERSLQEQLSVGDSLSSVQGLVQKHKTLISKAKEIFSLVPDLKIQIALIEKSSHNSQEVQKYSYNTFLKLQTSLKTVTDTCQIFQRKLDRRSNMLAHSLAYYQSYEKVTKANNILISICQGEASLIDSRRNIESAIDKLEEYKQVTKTCYAEFEKQANEFLILLEKEQDHPYVSTKYVSVNYLNEIRFVKWSLSEMEKRVRRCTESGVVSNEHMLKILQLKSAEEDAAQTITWLCELTDSIKHQHYALGTTPKETDHLRQQHEDIRTTAKRALDDGNKKLSVISVMRRNMDLVPLVYGGNSGNDNQKKTSSSNCLLHANGESLPSLEEAWKKFFEAWSERSSRLAVAYLFHINSEKVIKRASQLEVDLDNVFPLSSSGSLKRGRETSHNTRLLPLKNAHENLHQEMEHVLSVGNSLLKDVYLKGGSDPGAAVIQSTMQHLDFLRSSLHSKWSRVNKRKVSESRSPSASWIEGVKDSTDWIRVKLVEYTPCSCQIGADLKEAKKLLEDHEQLVTTLKGKESLVKDLLKRADDYGSPSSQSSSESDATYLALARSLDDMWKEMNALLTERKKILASSVNFYDSAEEFSKHLTFLEQYLKWDDLPADKSSAESFINTHEEMHSNMLKSSVVCLSQGQTLLNDLKRIKFQQPENKKSNYGSACTSIECTLEALIDRRRQVEHGYNKRKTALEQSLQTCEWESEVKRVIYWFNKIKDEELLELDLGSNTAEIELYQKHIADVKERVKTRLEKVKYLLTEASEQLSVFGDQPIAERARELDCLVEDLISGLDQYKDLLMDAGSFFKMADKSLEYLDVVTKSLENAIFSTDLEELDRQCSKFFQNISSATEDTLKSGENVLEKANNVYPEPNKCQAGGIQNMLTNINNFKSTLIDQVLKHRDEAIRINEMSGLYFRNCQELSDWMTKVAGEMLWNNPTLGSTHDNASKFLVWHQALMDNIQRKSTDLDSLVKTANVLLEAGVSQPTAVRDRAEELRADWSRLNKNAKKRIALAQSFAKHVLSANEVSDEMGDVQELLNRYKSGDLGNMNEVKRKEMQDKIQNIQEKCLNILEESQTITSKLKEREEDDNLDTESAIEECERIALQLRLQKDNLLDIWLTWQYRDSVEKDTSAQWQNLKNTADRLINALENLHQTVFDGGKVQLGFDVDSVEYLLKQLSDRQTLLHSIHGEVEKLVKMSEILNVKSPLENLNSKFGIAQSDLIKSVINHHKILQEKMKLYNLVLDLSKNWHKDFIKLESEMKASEQNIIEAERMSVVSQPKKESYVLLLLRNHNNTKREIDDVLVAVASAERQIASTLEQMRVEEAVDGEQVSMSERMRLLVNHHRKWRELWEQRNQTLCYQLDSAWYNNELRKQNLVVNEFENLLHKEQKKNRNLKNKAQASLFVKEMQNVTQRTTAAYENCESFIPLARDRMTRQDDKKEEVNKTLDSLREQWAKLRKSIETLSEIGRQNELYYTIAIHCENWQIDAKRKLSAIKQRISVSHAGEKMQSVTKMLDDINISEQEERLSAMKNIFSNSDSLLNKHDDITSELNSILDEMRVLTRRLKQNVDKPKITFATKVQPDDEAPPKKFVFVSESKSSFPPPGILKKSKASHNIIESIKNSENEKNANINSNSHPTKPTKINSQQNETDYNKNIIKEPLKAPNDVYSVATSNFSRPKASWASQIDENIPTGANVYTTDNSTDLSSGEQSDDTVKPRNATPDSFTSVTADEIDETITNSSTATSISDGHLLDDSSLSQASTLHSSSHDGEENNGSNENYIDMMGDFVQVKSVDNIKQGHKKPTFNKIFNNERQAPSPPPRKYGSLRRRLKNRPRDGDIKV